jgi:D-inositol-3-phosphate glycosyltransferase
MSSNKIDTLSKKSILCWSDSSLATTGFGTVARHILNALYATGKYSIDQLGINHPSQFYDIDQLPYSILPARLGNPTDPFGYQMLLDMLSKKDYDILFIINDTYVTNEIASKALQDHIQIRIQKRRKVFDIVYYYPIDCRLVPGTGSLIDISNRAVAYTKFAAEETAKAGLAATDIIYHGADINNFYPLPEKERQLARKQNLGVTENDTFVFVNVNRNGLRKDIAKTILAFSIFKKIVPNSVLYLHTCMIDGPNSFLLDLRIPIAELGLSTTKDVIYPTNLHPASGVDIKTLNTVYNMGDAFITTTLGEGFGLTPIEAMCCKVPVIAPKHTSFIELLGKNRSYLYPCKELTYIDNSGYRPVGHVQDIVKTMLSCYSDWSVKDNDKSNRDKIINNAYRFTRQYSWKNVCKQWIQLFESIGSKKSTSVLPIVSEIL